MGPNELIAAEVLASPVLVEPERLDGPAGSLALYTQASDNSGGSVALIHSVNAAASAHEMKSLFERWGASFDVFAVDLPGFGRSPRRAVRYDIALMCDAVLQFLEAVRARGRGPVHVVALSLASEFAARALVRNPSLGDTLTLVTPTGLSKGTAKLKTPGLNREFPLMSLIFEGKPWSRGVFDLLTSKTSIRYFYRRTFGGKEVPSDLVDYAYQAARPPGAEHAPLSFLSGRLFSGDVRLLYEQLPVPTCVIHGTKGDFRDFTEVDALRSKLKDLRVHAMDTGAMCHLEKPDQFDELLRAFIDSPRGSQ